jgi:phospholipase C
MRRIVLLTLGLACAVSCRPGAIGWGLDAIDSMETPADTPLACGIAPKDTAAAKRAACAFRSGARADETLGTSKSELARIPIRHVIIAMKENRSFDHVFGKLHEQGQPGVEPIPATFSNPDLAGNKVFPSHATTTCLPWDPGHQSKGMLDCVDGGKMDGFVVNAASTTGTDGSLAMQYYEASDLPFYYFLASTFAIADRHFSPMPTGTFANRDFMMFGTAAGVVDTGITYPRPSTPSIFHLLMSAGYTWGAYTDGNPFSGTLGWDGSEPGVHPTQSIYDALDHGTLPNVAFVDGVEDIEDDHPAGDLQFGEKWLKRLYDHAVKSPQWERTVIFFTYDEGGAFMDHVPPPDACRDDPSSLPPQTMGPRVPLIAISPWAKRNYVSHVVHDHTAITRFVETLFDLPALTARDANSDALLDLFDFSCGRDHAVPPAPEAGTGGCPSR